MKKEISVVIPAYNAAEWLPKSVPRVDEALKRAKLTKAEIIIVDDGSNDNTISAAINLKTIYPLRVVSQKNGGRFLARERGAKEARYEHILFIDTRIYIAPDALNFLITEISKNPERQVWTSHVYLDKKSNIYARFWDVIAMVAWRRYFSKPRDYSYGLKEFDYYPKGTTCFFVPRLKINEANKWFRQNTKDLKRSNDDTLLIRHIAESTNININPRFYCNYHARTSLRQYIKHVFHRGQVFVDGFLRRDGNRFFYPLIAFLVLSVIVPFLLIILPQFLVPFLLAGVVLWISVFLVLLALGISPKDASSVFILSPIFGVAYGAGIWKAFYRLYIKAKFDRRSAYGN